ncbi:MAG: hypothetical protein ACJ706_01460 [Nitrososphaeraceae archaeon]
MCNNRDNSSFSSSFFVIFFIIIVTFSLSSAGIVIGNTNNVIMGAHAEKIPSDKLRSLDSGITDDTSTKSADANPTPESSQPRIPTSEGSGSSASKAPSTTAQTDDQNGGPLIPQGIPLDQGNSNDTSSSQFANPPEFVTKGDDITTMPENNTGNVSPSSISNQTTTTEPITNRTTPMGNVTIPVTNGTNPSSPTNETSPHVTGNTTNISIAIAIAVQNIVNRISSGNTNNVQLQALIQQLITLLVKQGQANNPNIKFVELQSAPVNEFFANSTRLASTVRIISHAVFVDPSTGELFAKGVVKNTGTSTIASVNIFADEFDIANHFIQRTQSAPNTMPLKPGDSFNYTIDLRGHFTGKFDSHEIAAVKYQLTAKNSVAASAQSATG